jgi:hypothetical protein
MGHSGMNSRRGRPRALTPGAGPTNRGFKFRGHRVAFLDLKDELGRMSVSVDATTEGLRYPTQAQWEDGNDGAESLHQLCARR